MTDIKHLFNHPEYIKHYDGWVRLRDMLDGHPDIINDQPYLIPHRVEQLADTNAQKLWTTRKHRTSYMNFSQLIVNLWRSIFFRDEIDYSEVLIDADADPETADGLITEEELTNIDGQMRHFDYLIKNQIFEDRLNIGKSAVVINAIQNGTIETRADESRASHRVVLEHIHALDLKDWIVESQDPDRLGRFNMVRYEYYVIKERANETEPPQRKLRSRVYILLDDGVHVRVYEAQEDEKGNIQKQDDKIKWKLLSDDTLGDGDAQLQEVPIAMLNASSWLEDVIGESKRYHNARSTKDNVLLSQGYREDYFIGMPLDGNYIDKLGENIKTFLPDGVTVESLDPVDVGPYESHLEDAVNNIFKIGLNMLRLLPSDSRAVQGADSVQAEKDNIIAAVESALNEMQAMVDDITRMIAIFKDKPEFDGQIKLNKDISQDDVETFLRVVLAFRNEIATNPEWNTATLRKAVKKQNLPKEDEDRVLETLAEADTSVVSQQPAQTVGQRLLDRVNGNTTTAQINSSTTQAGA
jgi:hypothetical protein